MWKIQCSWFWPVNFSLQNNPENQNSMNEKPEQTNNLRNETHTECTNVCFSLAMISAICIVEAGHNTFVSLLFTSVLFYLFASFHHCLSFVCSVSLSNNLARVLKKFVGEVDVWNDLRHPHVVPLCKFVFFFVNLHIANNHFSYFLR